jgi:glycosyltransferase involved in cell wall biosynthesis
MNKILIITYYWPPAGGPGVQRWLKFAKYLPQHKIQPIILTVDPQYATYPIFDSSLEDEIQDDIKVIRTKSFELFSIYKKITGSDQVPYSGFATEENISFLQKISRFIRGNFFLPDPRKGWNKFALKAAKELIKKENIHLIITTGPPHSTHLIGNQLKKIYKNLNWTADFRDPWVDIFYYNKFYPTKFSKKIDTGFEKRTFENADKIIVVSNSMKVNYANKYSNQSHKIHVITNGYDPDDFREIVIKKK